MDLLTIKETAEILRVSPLTVRRYISRGLIHATPLGRTIRINRSEVEHLVEPKPSSLFRRGGIDPNDPSTWQPASERNSLRGLIGLVEDDGPTDVSSNIHKYIADAIEDWRE